MKKPILILFIILASYAIMAQEIPGVTKYMTNGRSGAWDMITDPEWISEQVQEVESNSPIARDSSNKYIYPLNAGDAYISNAGPVLDTNIFAYGIDSIIQDGSANTGTDYAMSTTYLAFKFTAVGSYTAGPIGVRVKKDVGVTNVDGTLSKYIYTDNAGVPGTAMSAISVPEFYGHISTTYEEYPGQVGGVSLVDGTAYWLVLSRTEAASGGSIYFDTKNTGTAMAATSPDGSTWTPVNNVTGWFKVHYPSNTVMAIKNINHNAITAYSKQAYAIEGYGVYDAAIRGVTVNAEGMQGNSTYGPGNQGNSTHGPGSVGISTNDAGGAFRSTNYYGVTGLTQKSGYAGVWGQGMVSGARGGFFESNNSYGAVCGTSSGTGLYAYAITGQPLYISANPANTSTQFEIMKVELGTSGTPAAGFGSFIAFYNEASHGGGDRLAGIGCQTQNVIHSQAAGSLTFHTTNAVNGFRVVMVIDSSGYIYNPSGSLVLKDDVINPKGTLANNDTSPSVAGGNVFEYNGTANSVSIDALDDHQPGAFYTIIGNSNTYTITIIDGTPSGGDSFNLAGGNWVGGNDDVLVLYCISADNFIEVSRSDN